MMTDQALFSFIGFGFGVYILVLLFQAGIVLRDWFRYNRTMDEIEDGHIPADYDAVTKEQERLNDLELSGDPIKLVDNACHNRRVHAIGAVREQCAHVRFAGYRIGEQDQEAGLKFNIGVQSNPFTTGSGSAKQWVRGYCSARNVLDIKRYYDAA